MTTTTAALSSTLAEPHATLPAGVYGREMRAEFIKMLRNRAYSASAIGFPVVFFSLFGSLNRHAGPATCLGATAASARWARRCSASARALPTSAATAGSS